MTTLLVGLLLAALLYGFGVRSKIDWQALPLQYRDLSPFRVALGVLSIYLCFGLRATRWAVLLRPIRRVRSFDLLPAQIIGFTAVALFGRVADLSRPYLIARRTQTPVTTQLAIYSVERAFDLAAAATLFSITLVLAPQSLPHHEAFAHAGLAAFAATLLLAAAVLALRISGVRIAGRLRHLLRPFSEPLADLLHARLLDLQHGFSAITSLREFFAAAALSLLMWGGIALTYWLSATAFRSTAGLVQLTFAGAMLLLASGIGGGLIQLPVLGWFTQIAIFAATLHELFAVPLDTATAAAVLIFAVTNLSIVPLGLVLARLQGTGLRSTVVAAEPSEDCAAN